VLATVVVAGVGLLVVAAFWCWYAAALAAVFGKLGLARWRAWVPVLNEVELLEAGRVPGWSVLYLAIPVVNLYGVYLHGLAAHRVNARFGRGAGLTTLAVLLPPVWASLLGWSRAQPDHEVARSAPDPSASVGASGPLADPGALPMWAVPPPADGLGAPAQAAGPVHPVAAPLTSPWAPVGSWAQTAGVTAVDPAELPVPPVPVPPVPAPLPPVPLAPVRPAPAPTAPVWPSPAAPTAAPTPPGPLVDAGPLVPVPAADPWRQPAVPVTDGGQRSGAPAPWLESVGETAVAAHLAAPDLEPEDDLDGTVVVARARFEPWQLQLDDGRVLPVETRCVVLGRRPRATELGVQQLTVPDDTRTLSKTHARLELVDDRWLITDLGSTNGVLLVGADGREQAAEPGTPCAVPGRFVLGSVGMRLVPPAGGSR
jgi:hypothetical protein